MFIEILIFFIRITVWWAWIHWSSDCDYTWHITVRTFT